MAVLVFLGVYFVFAEIATGSVHLVRKIAHLVRAMGTVERVGSQQVHAGE